MNNGGGSSDVSGAGGEEANLAYNFSALALGRNNSDGLFQVMKAVEAAEATIKQQADENTRLRTELQKKIQELEKYKTDGSTAQTHSVVYHWDDHARGPHRIQQLDSVVNEGDGVIRGSDGPFLNAPSTEHGILQHNVGHAIQAHADGQFDSSKVNGTLKVLPGGQSPVDTAGFSQFSSPSATSFSPSRHQMEGEMDARFTLSGHGMMTMAEVNNSGLYKQDLSLKVREHEEEIMQLRKHLADYSVKEAQIRNEKYVLEKRIAYMRMAFDQQQQDLVDAASKALSYRQDIIEENIRLTYALQAAEQERSTFVSSLLPLLAEYSLQPPVPDAQSIVSNVKVLFKHLQEKLIITEAKLKESQYQLAPWRSDVNSSNFPPQSPSYKSGVDLTTNKNGLELVPQPSFSHGNLPITSETHADWDTVGHHQSGLGDGAAKHPEPDDRLRYSPLASRDTASEDVPGQLSVTQGDSHPTLYNEETATRQVTFSDPVSSTAMDDLDGEGQQNEREPLANWGSKNSPYAATPDNPTSPYSHLPPVLEEPSSSFSEAGDDDLLPAIEGLQISGEAFPGRELQACGYSINGTTSCNFEWMRHLEDGSVNYIEGAKQPNYLVTADDVDTLLAIEVQPLDNRKRKYETLRLEYQSLVLSMKPRWYSDNWYLGELVRVFANEQRKITCDPEMQNCIEKTLHSGQASYRVSLLTGYLDIWEPATLMIKKDSYTIKGGVSSVVQVTEKFSPTMTVTIPFGHVTEFSISSSAGVEHILRAESNPTDVSGSRDTIVLTLRLFILKAGDKKRWKKSRLFFKS